MYCIYIHVMTQKVHKIWVHFIIQYTMETGPGFMKNLSLDKTVFQYFQFFYCLSCFFFTWSSTIGTWEKLLWSSSFFVFIFIAQAEVTVTVRCSGCCSCSIQSTWLWYNLKAWRSRLWRINSRWWCWRLGILLVVQVVVVVSVMVFKTWPILVTSAAN